MGLLLEIFVLMMVLAAVYGLVLWANRAKTDRSANVGLYLLFGLPGMLLTVAGLALAVNGQDAGWFVLALGLSFTLPLILRHVPRSGLWGPQAQVGVALLGVALAIGILRAILIGTSSADSDLAGLLVRSAWVFVTLAIIVLGLQLLNWAFGSAIVPMDRKSPIDMMGLGVILALASYFMFVLSLGPAEDEAIAPVTVGTQLVNVIFFVLVAYVAVGTNIYRTPGEAHRRLGLSMPKWTDVVIGAAAVLPTLMLSMLGSLLTLYFQPDLFEDLGDTMEQMSAGTNVTLISILIFASAGVGEEILFRGAIQPRFGIILTSAFWALVHTQYQLTFVVLGLFLAGILFGLIRKYVGTTPAIIAHALYNAAVVGLQSLG